MSNAAIAVLAGVSGFLLFLLQQAIVKSYERATLHYNAIIKLERALHAQLDRVLLAIGAIVPVRAALADGQIVYALPNPLELPKGLDTDVADLELVNEILMLSFGTDRVDDDIRNARAAYEQIKGLVLGQKINREGYILTSAAIGDRFDQISRALGSHRSEVQRLLVLARLALQRRQPFAYRTVLFIRDRFFLPQNMAITESEIEAARKFLAEEQSTQRYIGGGSTPPDLSQTESASKG